MSFSLIQTPSDNPDDDIEYESDIEVIKGVINRLMDEGVVVIAASGNTTHTTTINSRPEPRFPGNYERVISVGARNYNNSESCFTHDADIFAPGGEAIPTLDVNGDMVCVATHALCTLSKSCDAAVMSFATQSPTHFAYWIGTSFASPLIAGLVALRLGGGDLPTHSVCLKSSLDGTYKVVDVEGIEDEFMTGAPCTNNPFP